MSIFDYGGPRTLSGLLREERERFLWDRAVRDPGAQVKVPDVVGPRLAFGMGVIESDFVPDGTVLVMQGTELMGVVTAGRTIVLPRYNRYGERAGVQALRPTPLWTRHMLGVIEGARARRRARRGWR